MTFLACFMNISIDSAMLIRLLVVFHSDKRCSPSVSSSTLYINITSAILFIGRDSLLVSRPMPHRQILLYVYMDTPDVTNTDFSYRAFSSMFIYYSSFFSLFFIVICMAGTLKYAAGSVPAVPGLGNGCGTIHPVQRALRRRMNLLVVMRSIIMCRFH